MNKHFSTPEQAAMSYAKSTLAEGYVFQSLHSYTDIKGNSIYWRIRLKHRDGRKWIRPMYKNDNNAYHLGEPPHLEDTQKPLYGLYRLNQHPNAVVYIVEGEYAADTLNTFFDKYNAAASFIAVTSGSAASADAADWSPMQNRICILWPDNDEAGQIYAKKVSHNLKQKNCPISIIDVSKLSLAKGGDCVDWLQNNIAVTLADLSNIETYQDIFIAPSYTSNPVTNNISFPASASLEPADIAIYPEPVHPSDLLAEIATTIPKFIICHPETTHATALWVMMTWVIDAINVAPLAIITAPEKRCGKSQLLFLMSKMVYNPIVASNITPAALFRTLDQLKPTLLIDETDAFIKENEELRGILNCGHTRDSAYTVRLVGKEHTPTKFFVFGPKALAGIGNLPDTIMDRGIKLELRRKLQTEKIERLRHADPSIFAKIRSKLARFAQDYAGQIKRARPILPDELNDRAQDNWESLLAIADLAAGEWPKLARKAALKLSIENAHTQSTGIELLADIQEIFANKNKERVSSTDLIEALCKDEEKAWLSFNKGQPIKPRQIATYLKEYGISSKTIRLGSITIKGYEKSQFDDAFARYLTVSDEFEVTTSQADSY